MSNTNRSRVLFGEELLSKVPEFDTFSPTCVFRGKDARGDNAFVPLDQSVLSKHILLLGGIGTGKTNTFFQMVSQISRKMTDSDVMIIFDTKGDFYKEFYQNGDIVISNDKTACGDGRLDYWNIFNEVSGGEHMQESVSELAGSIFAQQMDKTNQIFFPTAAKDLFMACMLHFIRTKPKRVQTNKNLIEYICKSTTKDLKAMLLQHEDLKGMVSYIDGDGAQAQGVKAELDQAVRNIFVGNFRKTGTLSLKKIVGNQGKKRVFIEYDMAVGSVLTPIYSLMFDCAIKEALSRKQAGGNVYFITDEFSLLPYLEHIDDAVNFGRSLGIKFVIGVQNVEQVYVNYGEERGRSILSGFTSSILFRVNDPKSREFIQERFGHCQKLEGYIPTIQTKGIIENQREAWVIEDWDISQLRTGQAIMDIPNVSPFLFQFDIYK